MRLRSIATSAAAIAVLGGGAAAAQSDDRPAPRPSTGAQAIRYGECGARAARGEFGPNQGWTCLEDETP